MPNIELLVKHPNIGLDADTSRRYSGEQRYLSPVIIVRMACDRYDVTCEVCRPMIQPFALSPNLGPVLDDRVDIVREEGSDDSKAESNELDNTTVS